MAVSVILPARFAAAALVLWVAGNVLGQEPTVKERHESVLGQTFVPIPGTTILMSTTETRVSDFRTFAENAGYSWTFKPHFDQRGDHPVVGVNLQDAIAFCNWLTQQEREAGKLTMAESYRLPTGEEWSAAAGQSRNRQARPASAEQALEDQRRYPWGMQWPPPIGAGNLSDSDIPEFIDDFPFTAPVGKSTASPDGLFDLAGNAWEWTWDLEQSMSGSGVLRGGSWAYFRQECLRAAYEYEVPAEMRAATVGFRVVYEDKSRTAKLLAVAKEKRDLEMEERRDQVLGGAGMEVSQEELEAMRARLSGAGSSDAGGLDASNVKPMVAGESYQNLIGLNLLPLGETGVWLAATETTAQQYETFLEATGKTWPAKPRFLSGRDQPAASVSWNSALEFADWLTRQEREAGLIPATARYRLPSDLEWSAAAGLPEEVGSDPEERSGAGVEHFPWAGAAWPPSGRVVNIDATKVDGFDDSYSYLSPVDISNENEQGFFELGGNVAEWTMDAWPSDAAKRVVRGGSWLSFEKEKLMTGFREPIEAGAERPTIGFRLALEAPDA